MCKERKKKVQADSRGDSDAIHQPPRRIDSLDKVQMRHVSGLHWSPRPYDCRGPKDLSARVFLAWDEGILTFDIPGRPWEYAIWEISYNDLNRQSITIVARLAAENGFTDRGHQS